MPSWMFNRRKDSEVGKDEHILSAELALKLKLILIKPKKSGLGVDTAMLTA